MENKIKKMRLDLLLVEQGLVNSREEGKTLILEGKVFVNNQREDKAGSLFKEDSCIEIKGEKLKYVSRGGLKLEKAMQSFNISFENKICLDIGASTGGFTDLMLQNGAKKVYSVDVGTNQLDYKLRTDNRVVCIEQTNAKDLTKDIITDNIDFVSMDVSFISITKIIPVIKNIAKRADCVFLIKPQFEAGKKEVDIGKGVITDPNIHKRVIDEIINFLLQNNFEIKGLDFSPIKGPKGNIEFLIYVRDNESVSDLQQNEEELRKIFKRSEEVLKEAHNLLC